MSSLRGIAMSLLRGLLALLLVLAVLVAGFMGWHAQACGREFTDGAGWGLMAAMLLPLAFPQLGVLLAGLVIGGAIGVASLLRGRRGMLVVAGAMLLLAGAACGVGFLLARLLHASARCSFGF